MKTWQPSLRGRTHVGYLSAAYTAGVLVGAPIWGLIADRVGRPRIS